MVKFKRYSNYRSGMIFLTILYLIFFLFMLRLGAGSDKDGKHALILFFCEYLLFFTCVEFYGKFGIFYDTVYCNENGIVIKTREKTINLVWADVKYIRAITSKGGVIGWAVITWDEKKYKLFPPRMLMFNDYVKSIRPDIEVKRES